MSDNKIRILLSSVRKLLKRNANRNIARVLEKTHTADIALLLSELDAHERLFVFQLEKKRERRSKILSYLREDIQKEFLETLPSGEINALVSLMASDDVADLLARLEKEQSKKILDGMSSEEKVEVEDLMSYPEDSAGGIMNSDVLALDQNLTVSEAIHKIQKIKDENLITFYVYVIDEDSKLLGVLSLKQLILSKPESVLKDLMNKDVIAVGSNEAQEAVAKIVARYDFLSLPVVDEHHTLLGIVTVDDVIDVIREEADEDLYAMGQIGGGGRVSFLSHFKSRCSWLSVAFLGGIMAFMFLKIIFSSHEQWVPFGLLPLFLALGTAVGHQSATFAVGSIRQDKLGFRNCGKHLSNEVALSLLIGGVFGGALILFTMGMGFLTNLAFLLGVGLVVQIVLSMSLGSLVPLLLQQMGMDPAVSTVSVVTAISNMIAIFVLFGLVHWVIGWVGLVT